MAWTSLADRLDSLPLIICGPILRRTEVNSVTVWFVLKENKNCILSIYGNSTSNIALLSGTQTNGVKIGDHVFIFCITAYPINSTFLSKGVNYFYDIQFGDKSLSQLISSGLDLTFNNSNRPSFSLPPDDINLVRLLHGSCRMPHGEGQDAMEGIHDMIQTSLQNNGSPITRPHMLLLTGDQIYADDVADVLLFMINDAANVLFGWDESTYNSNLSPGKRNLNNFIKNEIGFTGMIPDINKTKSHLLKFREYSLMYIFVWSDILWPVELPKHEDVYPGEPIGKWVEVRTSDGFKSKNMITYPHFSDEYASISKFQGTLKKIRKALANVPTYMIFDDHEITDDWNINWHWCQGVYKKELGRRTVQNGLLAYALFQGWGNTPEQFKENGKKEILSLAKTWRGDSGSDFESIGNLLNVNGSFVESSTFAHFIHNSNIINWYFNIQFKEFSVYFLDSRTWRYYKKGLNTQNGYLSKARLVSADGYLNQLPNQFNSENKIVLIVAPAPIIGVPFVEEKQSKSKTLTEILDKDAEAWSLNKIAFELLLSNLGRRVPIISNERNYRFAILSGDVHYGFSARMQLWGNSFYDESVKVKTNILFSQLTASSFRNQTSSGFESTNSLHTIGYNNPLSYNDNIDAISNSLPTPIEKFIWKCDMMAIQIGLKLIGYRHFPYRSDIVDLHVRSQKKLEKEGVESISKNPDYSYRIDYILGNNTGSSERTEITPHKVDIPPNINNRTQALESYLNLANDHSENYIGKWGDGKEIVGKNNVGEIKFLFNQKKSVKHILWWRLSNELQIFPLTTFEIPLNLNNDKTSDDGLIISKPTYNGMTDE